MSNLNQRQASLALWAAIGITFAILAGTYVIEFFNNLPTLG